MPDWLMWVVLAWVMVAVFGRRAGGFAACGGHRSRRRVAREPASAELGERERPMAALPRKDELEARLRARFVAGELSLEAYERELDRLYASR